MLALAYSFALFLIWTLVGRALFAIVAPRYGALRAWLLAPGVGLAATLLCVMVLNQVGLPVRAFSRPMTAVLVLASTGILVWRRPITPGKSLLPFLGAVIVSLLWTGWPAFQAGFNWISYGNDDMANYCMAAERFASYGFFHVPTMADLGGRDYTAYFFFMHTADMMRFGGEHVVAWSATLVGLKAIEAFMPSIVALSLVQLFGAAGLALHAGRHRRLAIVTVWILAVLPLFMLGTLYQLIAQVAGVGLMLTTLALLSRAWITERRCDVLRYSLLPAIAGAGLCITYPETTPFAGLTYMIFLGLSVVRRRMSVRLAVGLTAYVLLGITVLLHYNMFCYLATVVMQLGSATHEANLLLSLFPFFLIPTGFSNFFGWMPIARDFAEPAVTISIIGGMLLSLVLIWRMTREAWQVRTAAILLVIDTAVAVYFYRGRNDFPLYKLAMWMQPPLAIALAGLLVNLRSRVGIGAIIALFAVSTAPTALYYTRSSEGSISGGMTELRFASQLGMKIPPPANANAQVTVGVENVVAAKFAVSELRGYQLALASRDYFFPNTRIDFRDPPPHAKFHPHIGEMEQARPLMIERNTTLVTTSALWHTEFSQPVVKGAPDYYLFLATQLSLFNKFGHDPTEPIRSVFELKPAADVRNQLMFVHSGRGNHYYLGDRRFISFFQQETDPYAPSRTFNGLGRFMLLRVENPTDEIYLRVAATRTLLPKRTPWSEKAVVHAEQDMPLGAIGTGAFNLFIGPLRPHKFQNAHFIAIDLTDFPKPILDPRTGLKAAYNRFIPLDYRRLLGWARDISVISPEEYKKLERPTRIVNFPADLATATTLEFSGIYEDGWISPDSKFVLGAAPAKSVLRVRGFVPQIPGTPLGKGNLQLSVATSAAPHRVEMPATTGQFDWLVPMPEASTITRLGLHFTAGADLPNGDDRPAAAKIEGIEILPALPLQKFDYANVGSTRLASGGMDQDGWMTSEASIELPAFDTPTQVILRFEFPGWTGATQSPLRAQLTGESLPEHTLTPANATVQLNVSASAKPRTLRLTTGPNHPLPAPDTRQRAGRLLQLEFVPAVVSQQRPNE